VLSINKKTQKRELFKLLNRYFDKVYLITLKRSVERHPLIQNLLDGLEYEIFWGVDGQELDIGSLRKKGKVGNSDLGLVNNQILTPGEIGCALSRVGVYREILDQKLNNALILEDDLILKDDYEEVSESLIQSMMELPENWELLYLGYANNNNSMGYQAYLRAFFIYPILSFIDKDKFDPGTYRRRYPREYSSNLQKAGYHHRTHAYAVSKSGARKILQFQTPVSQASDHALSTLCIRNKINAFRLRKKLFYQNRDLESTIYGRYEDSRNSPHDY